MNNIANAKKASSIKDVASYFGVSVRTIRGWMVKDPAFPKPFKKFGTLRFNQSEIKTYWKVNQENN